jgi:DNA-binding Lrp family transcriptional regulator
MERCFVTARKLDDFDCRAIYLLQRNARLTNRKLANALGLSETACAARVKRLESMGVIVGYSAILGGALTDHRVRAWVDVRLSDPTPAALKAFEAALVGNEDVAAAYRTAGPADYLIKVSANRIADIEGFLDQLRTAEVECHALRQAVILRDVKALSPRGLPR